MDSQFFIIPFPSSSSSAAFNVMLFLLVLNVLAEAAGQVVEINFTRVEEKVERKLLFFSLF